MHIVTVVPAVDARSGGGVGERGVQLARRYPRLGGADVSSEVLTLDLDLTPDHLKMAAPATVTALPCRNRRYYLPGSPTAIAERVRAADVVHLINHWTVLNALAAEVAARCDVPYVFSPCGALPIRGRSRLTKRAYDLAVGSRLVRRAAAIIAVTDPERADFVPYGVDRHRVLVVPNGVSASDHEQDTAGKVLARYGLTRHRYVLFLGRLNWIKGVDLLVDAFISTVPAESGWRCVVAGPDQGMLTDLTARVSAAGVGDQVCFTGMVRGPERTELLRGAALLVVPSRHEAMSIVALEAGINGTPVLITNSCGFDEVEQIGGGWVVPATTEALAGGLRVALHDPQELERRGEALRKLVSHSYTWERAAGSHLEIFEKVVASRRRHPAS
ncbi:glycosyltransferase [Parafrankia sp. EUN1f]|uniref:glycosyltransferase n=1 Tax=Parafrankia sp. EUN1f TaxID=102897 RepID=UPI0001C44600|nr:glycosyltransferase [Parafrankia sp. EUN1f]EFC85846.1 glycosyl transferase group 1 [Parafrankia sp. EUN1f]